MVSRWCLTANRKPTIGNERIISLSRHKSSFIRSMMSRVPSGRGVNDIRSPSIMNSICFISFVLKKCWFKLLEAVHNARIPAVNLLRGFNPYTKVVVGYRPSILQAVEDSFKAVVKVIGVAALIDDDMKPKGAVYTFASIDFTLVVETAFIRPYFLILDDSFTTLPVGDGLVVVGLADRLSLYGLPYQVCSLSFIIHCYPCLKSIVSFIPFFYVESRFPAVFLKLLAATCVPIIVDDLALVPFLCPCIHDDVPPFLFCFPPAYNFPFC